MNQQFDVLIVGGGIIGLSAALSMALQNFSVAVIDASDLDAAIAPSLRVYAINQASEALFKEIGVWERIDQSQVSSYQQMYVWDAASGAAIDFDARLIAANRLGVILEESRLRQALMEKIKEDERITLFSHHEINSINPSNKAISIASDKSSWQGQLLMVADGSQSMARQLLKIPVTTWSYQQHAVVATVKTEKPHRQTAWQVFNKGDILAFLPLANTTRSSIVWSTSPEMAKELINLPDEAFNQRLTETFANKLGQAQTQSPRLHFPLTMRHVQQYSGERWLILGDAAHSIHPLAGLGLNVGLADLSTWLNCLAQNNNHLLSKKALSAYQRQRKHAVWQIIALMDGLKALFNPSFPPLVALRSFGLKLTNQFSPLKRFLIKQATGT